MFCTACGAKNLDTAVYCTACNQAFDPPIASSTAAENIRASSEDAWNSLLAIARNPVGGLPAAFEKLGSARALRVGIAFGLVFALCAATAFVRLSSAWLFRTFLADSVGGSGFIRATLVFFVPFLGLAFAILVCRALARAKGSLGQDAFLAGTVLLPFASFAVLFVLLGAGNIEIILVALIFAQCLTIMMLYSGLTHICGINEMTASFSVPAMLIASAWVSKVIYVALLANV